MDFPVNTIWKRSPDPGRFVGKILGGGGAFIGVNTVILTLSDTAPIFGIFMFHFVNFWLISGDSTAEVQCIRTDDKSVVSEIYCDAESRPHRRTKSCNEEPCPPE